MNKEDVKFKEITINDRPDIVSGWDPYQVYQAGDGEVCFSQTFIGAFQCKTHNKAYSFISWDSDKQKGLMSQVIKWKIAKQIMLDMEKFKKDGEDEKL